MSNEYENMRDEVNKFWQSLFFWYSRKENVSIFWNLEIPMFHQTSYRQTNKQNLKILWFTFIVGYVQYTNMFPIDSMEDNNPNDIIKVPINPTRIHEHNFILVKTEKEQTTILCSTCNSLYCEKCGKLVTISDQNYMQYNIYN